MPAQQEAAIDAAHAAGVNHVVKVSALGATPGGPLTLGAHARVESYLATSGLEATVLRPNTFLQNLLTGFPGFTDEGDLFEAYGGGAVAHIDVEDIAACAYAVLTGAAPRGGVHDLTGPRALTPADLAAALSSALNRPIGVVQPSLDDLVPIMRGRGFPAAFTQELATLDRSIAAGSLAKVTSSVADLTGKPPRTDEAFLAEHAEELRRLVSPAPRA